ncbi:MAG: hypothetical protein AB7Q01_16650 [Gammaproteobacteria bacterium]
MPLPTLSSHDETLEVLAYIQRGKEGDVICHFVDASGNKVRLRLNPQVAHDLQDELADLLSAD